MTGPTLSDFLLARIAEDEAATVRSGDYVEEGQWGVTRVLAECEAKRRIVALHSATDWGMAVLCDHCRDQRWPCPTLRALALPYADHPDYREEWKP